MLLVAGIVKHDSADIDVRLLLAFDAMMAELSVTRAAEQLGITQQGLSGQLARLRACFGDPLFVRDGAAMAATPRAERLLPPVQEVLARLQALVEAPAFDPRALEGTMVLTATDYAASLLLPPLLNRLRLEAPGLRLALRSGNAATLEAEMRDRRSDLALIVPQFTPPGLHSRKLFGERYVGAVRPGHPLAVQAINLDSFCHWPHLLVSPNKGDFDGPTDRALAKIGRKRQVALVVPSFAMVAELVENTDLVAVLPERFVQRLPARLFAFEPPVAVEGFEIHAVWPARLNADPLQRWFRHLCFEVAKAIASGGRG